MAEYYGNRPSRDYFTLISALDATFSLEKVGSGENPDLFTLSKGFQQEERFPSQPEYQYRIPEERQKSGGGDGGGGNTELVFQQVDCLACCNYPCPPEWSDFNPGTLEVSFSDGGWQSHPLVDSISDIPTLSLPDWSSIPEFSWHELTEVGTETGSWSWGNWSSEPIPEGGCCTIDGEEYPLPQWLCDVMGGSWTFLPCDDWPGGGWLTDENLNSGGWGNYECRICGGYSFDPATSAAEAWNQTASYAGKITVGIDYEVVATLTKWERCSDSGEITESKESDVVDDGVFEIPLCPSPGPYYDPIGGIGPPPTPNGWQIRCQWTDTPCDTEDPEGTPYDCYDTRSFSIYELVDGVTEEGVLEHDEDIPQISPWGTTGCGDPCGDTDLPGVSPGGEEGTGMQGGDFIECKVGVARHMTGGSCWNTCTSGWDVNPATGEVDCCMEDCLDCACDDGGLGCGAGHPWDLDGCDKGTCCWEDHRCWRPLPEPNMVITGPNNVLERGDTGWGCEGEQIEGGCTIAGPDEDGWDEGDLHTLDCENRGLRFNQISRLAGESHDKELIVGVRGEGYCKSLTTGVMEVKLDVTKKSWIREVKAQGALASGPSHTGVVSFYWKMKDGCFDPDDECETACECFNGPQDDVVFNLEHSGFDSLPAYQYGPLPPGGGDSIWEEDLVNHSFAERADVPWQSDSGLRCNCDCEGNTRDEDGECVPACWDGGYCAGDLCCSVNSSHPYDPSCGEKETGTSLAIEVNITGISLFNAALCDNMYSDCPILNEQG